MLRRTMSRGTVSPSPPATMPVSRRGGVLAILVALLPAVTHARAHDDPLAAPADPVFAVLDAPDARQADELVRGARGRITVFVPDSEVALVDIDDAGLGRLRQRDAVAFAVRGPSFLRRSRAREGTRAGRRGRVAAQGAAEPVAGRSEPRRRTSRQRRAGAAAAGSLGNGDTGHPGRVGFRRAPRGRVGDERQRVPRRDDLGLALPDGERERFCRRLGRDRGRPGAHRGAGGLQLDRPDVPGLAAPVRPARVVRTYPRARAGPV